jgi:hypothetical protein
VYTDAKLQIWFTHGAARVRDLMGGAVGLLRSQRWDKAVDSSHESILGALGMFTSREMRFNT